MGCSINNDPKNKNKSQNKKLELDGQKIFYSQDSKSQQIKILNGSYNFIQVKNHGYILYWDVKQTLNIFDPQISKKYTFPLQGQIERVTVQKNKILVITSQRLYLLQIIDNRIKILKQFIIFNKIQKCLVHQIFYDQNLILERQNNQLSIIQLGINNKPKRLFQIRSNPNQLDELFYSQQQGILVQYFSQQYIEIIDVISKIRKKVNIRQPPNSLIEIKFMKIVENNIELIIYVSGKGFFLNRINYQTCLIEATKFLYYDVRDTQIIEDHQMLSVLTLNYYMRFDKDYNILQKFEINFDLENLKNQNIHRWLFKRLSNYMILMYELDEEEGINFRIYKQNQGLKRGELWIEEVKNYQVELGGDPFISLNQKYLAFEQRYILIFYYIEQKIEKQLIFDQQIKFLGFSINSQNFYVSSDNTIICFYCQQNLKIKYIWIQRDDQYQKRNFSTGQNGLLAVIDQEGTKICKSQPRKLIFKLNHQINHSRQHFYWTSSHRFLIQNRKKIFIYRLADRKQIINIQIRNLNCRLFQNGEQLIILTIEGQLQLWHLNSNDATFKRPIMDNVQALYTKSIDRIIFLSKKELIVLDASLELVEKIHSELVLLTENYILLVKQQTKQHLAIACSLVKRK